GGSCNVVDGGHNLDQVDVCGFMEENGSLSNAAPLFDPRGLRDNGGPTQTFALCNGLGDPLPCTGRSPAIGAGDPTVCASPAVNDVDQRGFSRLETDHAGCSIGAYEAGSAGPAQPCTGDCEGVSSVTADDIARVITSLFGPDTAACPKGLPAGV